MGWAGHVASKGKMRNAHNVLVGKSEGAKRPLRSPRKEGNIGMYLWEIRWKDMD
jgi:hypothetical protein